MDAVHAVRYNAVLIFFMLEFILSNPLRNTSSVSPSLLRDDISLFRMHEAFAFMPEPNHKQ